MRKSVVSQKSTFHDSSYTDNLFKAILMTDRATKNIFHSDQFSITPPTLPESATPPTSVEEVKDIEISNAEDIYPGDDGDLHAVLCCIGVWFALFIRFGILNIPGMFVMYWKKNQLKEYSESQVSWIMSIQWFLTLGGSIFTGRWFDLHGGRVHLPMILL
jgi:hypothetical protein